MGLKAGDRKQLLAAEEGGRLFFAGEHTNVYVNTNVQGAMETGRWAAVSAMAALEEMWDWCDSEEDFSEGDEKRTGHSVRNGRNICT